MKTKPIPVDWLATRTDYKSSLISSVLLWCVAVYAAHAQILNVPIVGPTEVDSYEPIELGCNCVVPAEGSVIVDWSSIPAGLQFLPADGGIGKVVHAWGAPLPNGDSYQVTAKAIIADWTARTLTQQVYRGKLRIGHAPLPGPDPVPPKPVPPKPPGPDKFGLVKRSMELALTLPDVDLSKLVKVKMPDGNILEVSQLQAVAANYHEVAKQIKAGEQTDPQTAINMIKERNHEILAAGAGQWPDKFFNPLGKTMNALWTSGEVKNIEDWGVALDDIYKGLSSINRLTRRR